MRVSANAARKCDIRPNVARDSAPSRGFNLSRKTNVVNLEGYARYEQGSRVDEGRYEGMYGERMHEDMHEDADFFDSGYLVFENRCRYDSDRPAFEGITPGQKLFSFIATCVAAFLLILIPGLYLS